MQPFGAAPDLQHLGHSLNGGGAGCDNMTCCIVLLNPAATAASLPPLASSSSEHSCATTGLLSARASEQAAKTDRSPQTGVAPSGDALPTHSAGLSSPAQATAVP